VTSLKNDILERIVERYRQVFIIFASQKLLTVWSFYGKRYSTEGLFLLLLAARMLVLSLSRTVCKGHGWFVL
jgi:hypothetical protein